MRIAIIGTGIAGLSAAWLLNQRHDITVYEADDRIGGHSNTVDARIGDRSIPVDTGFIVFNDRTYPNLNALFAALEVPFKPSSMSFSVSVGGGALEYAGDRIASLFAQRRNLFRPAHYRMIADILRFYRESVAMVAADRIPDHTLGRLLADGGYGRAFIYDHILPMGSAIWSADIREMLDFPASTFLRFFANHGLLTVNDQPQWLTVEGGSRVYVERLSAPFRSRIRTGTPVRAVRRGEAGVVVETDGQAPEIYDEVVFATHADTTRALLADADAQEEAVLGQFPFQPNTAILHTDPALMPRRRRAWASWNYMSPARVSDGTPVSVTYWMNRLQSLPCTENVFVSVNPTAAPDPARVLGTFAYDHPVFNAGAIAAQAQIGTIQGRRRIWVCGAWTGYGFHEDGLSSALEVAHALGVPRPWNVRESSTAAANCRPAIPAAANLAEAADGYGLAAAE
jgi:predicted NAD/FAD-binding protein